MIDIDALKRDKRPQSSTLVHALIDRLEAAEKELAELRSSMKFRTSLIGRTEAERDDAKAAAENIALKLDYLRSKLETAKSAQNDWLRANAPGGWIDNLRIENEALRAKVEQMEKQEPARLVTPTAYRWRYRGAVMWQYGELTEETARLAKEHNHEVQPLYALPGAHPAPSVPDGWLRAIDEAAESECLEQARLNGMGSEREAALMAKLEAAERERDDLRAKVEQMEKQEPVGKIVAFGESLHEPSWRAGRLPPLMTELYALPGAKGE